MHKETALRRLDRRNTVGVIGLGNIGLGVAETLIGSRRWNVLVWDRIESARRHFESRSRVLVVQPGEMAVFASIIFLVVPATPEILECMQGKRGIFSTAKRGLTVYDLTTSDPQDTRRVAKQAAQAGIAYLDAGTSGGPYKARTGKLLAMVGGDRRAFNRTRHVLNDICEHVFYIGPSGAGHTLKLLHNIVCHATTLATAEAGHMAEAAGIPLKEMIDVFNVSNARSYATEFRFPRHIISKTWDGLSRIYNLHKDIRMGVKLGRRLHADTTFSIATLNVLSRAMDSGMSDEDYTVLYRDFNKIRQAKPSHRK